MKIDKMHKKIAKIFFPTFRLFVYTFSNSFTIEEKTKKKIKICIPIEMTGRIQFIDAFQFIYFRISFFFLSILKVTTVNSIGAVNLYSDKNSEKNEMKNV